MGRPASATRGGSAGVRQDALRVAFVALGLYAAGVVGVVITQGVHPEWFVKFGAAGETTTYGRLVLGSDILVPLDESQDGTTFWMLSRDPLLTDAPTLNRYGNVPAYRSQRILYPALAAPWRLFGEQGLLWGLVLTNLAVVLVGTYVTGRLSQHLGGTVKAGYAFALSPAVVLSFLYDLADGLAAALFVGVILLVRRQRWGWAIATAVATVLAREPMLLALLAVALATKGPRRDRISLVALPTIVAAAWFVAIRIRLGWSQEGQDNFVVIPFKGYVDSYRYGWSPDGRYDEMLFALVLLSAGVWVIARFWRRRTIEMAACLPFVLILPFYAGIVLNRAINSLRVTGPIVALITVDVLAQRAAERKASSATLT